MKVRLLAFVIWAAVAASVMFWALRLGASSPAAPAHTVAVGAAAAPRGDLTRVLGAAPVSESAASAVVVASPLASRFRLLGVAAPRQGGDRNGLALIAVDGKPARSYVVGASIDGDLVLQSVHQRGAKIGGRGAAAPQVSLDLPALPAPARGSLPLASSPPAPALLPPATGGGAPGTTTVPPQIVVPPPDQGEQAPVPVPPPPSQSTATTR